MSKDRWATWERTRQIGFAKFVVFRGVLGFGTLWTVLHAVLDEWEGRPPTGTHPMTWLAVQGLIGGIFWGIALWCMMEWLRNRRQSHRDVPDR